MTTRKNEKRLKPSLTESQMQKRLAEITSLYDFGLFTMASFRQWIEQYKGCRIFCIPSSLLPATYGICLSSKDHNVILYEKHTRPIHRSHIKLHELAHILLDHYRPQVSSQHIRALFRQIVDAPTARCTLPETIPLVVHSDEEELEAETLASLIQEEVLQHNRLSELEKTTQESDFVTDFATYIRTIESYT